MRLNIEVQHQRDENWCYATVCESIVNYYSGTNVVSQEQIAYYYANRTNDWTECYKMQDPFDFLDEKGFVRKVVKTRSAKAPTFDVVYKEIKSGNPILVKIADHLVLIVGCSNLDSKELYYEVADPLDNKPMETLTRVYAYDREIPSYFSEQQKQKHAAPPTASLPLPNHETKMCKPRNNVLTDPRSPKMGSEFDGYILLKNPFQGGGKRGTRRSRRRHQRRSSRHRLSRRH
jgi:hypothetical protein